VRNSRRHETRHFRPSAKERNAIGLDLMRIQFRWLVGMPLCRAMGDGLREIRTNLPSGLIVRVLFCLARERIVVLHGFIKKTRRTPDDELALAPSERKNLKENNMAKSKKKKASRSTADLSTLDDFLKDQGKLEEFQATAIKEVLAWQIIEAMKAKNISRKGLAEKMKTSRSQISRLLDPKDGNVTLSTLQRAAKMVGRSLRLELV
jgi:phage-related protein/DNA-binding Xre family transcriptional regulator